MTNLEGLKDLVLNNIEDSGFMNQIRAQLKLQVYKIIEGQDEQTKTKTGFQWQHPLISQLKAMENGINSLELIIEYLEYFKLDYTAQVLRKESNMQDVIIRESLASRVGLQGKQSEIKPLIIIILGEFMKAVTEGFSPTRKPPANDRPQSAISTFNAPPPQREVPSTTNITKAAPKPEPAKPKVEEKVVAPPPPPKKENPSAVNKIRGAKSTSIYGFEMKAAEDPYAIDITKNVSSASNDPYAFDLGGGSSKTNNVKGNNKIVGNKFNSNPYDFDLEPPKKATNRKQEIEEDIDEFIESKDKDNYKQSNNMFTSSEDMMRATQSMGVDESVDSLALEDYDYYEDVTRKK